jgi:hypothetical protein
MTVRVTVWGAAGAQPQLACAPQLVQAEPHPLSQHDSQPQPEAFLNMPAMACSETPATSSASAGSRQR